VEGPPSSERAATPRRDNDQESAGDGIGVDGGREYQRIFGGKRQCGSVWTRTFSI